ncbi:MAG: CotH kinase family protein [Verrucomicrobiales bacterium]|nr:CotH kinase family protein [Verrucomicrobiales bacterium]
MAFSFANNAAAALRINEIVASNQTGLRDESGQHPDWIELYNEGADAVDLTGWALSDDPRQPRRWVFQSGRLAPGAFLVIYASGEDRQPLTASPVDPATVPGLATWLRAADLQRQSGALLRTSGADRFVRRWPDLSGHGNSAVQDSSSRQPRWFDGPQPAIRFDGVDDLLRLPKSTGTNDFTVIAIMTPTSGHEVDPQGFNGVGGTAGQRWLFGANHGGDFGAGAGISAGTNGVSVYEHGSGYMPAVLVAEAPLNSAPTVVTLTYRNRQPSLSLHGIELSEVGESVRATVTAPVEIGSGSYGAFAGDVFEVLMFDRALSALEIRGIELTLAQNYAHPLADRFHTNFRLSASGEWLGLTRPDGVREDEIQAPRMPRDVAWGRFPDGATATYYFATPTPGSGNSSVTADTALEAPQLSHVAGFYSNAFSLEIRTSDSDAEIRYTLDGSEPTAESTRYTSPLGILNRTLTPSRIANIPTAPNWRAPSGNVFKGTLVRARAFRTNALPSPVVTATYFVDPKGRARYGLPVVALSSDPKNFFSAETGIYVVGNAPGGNYAQTGDAWERPVHVEFMETDGSLAFSNEAGVRMHGNTSFGFPIKALRLHASNQGGTGPFRYRIFPDLPIDSFDRLLLRPSGHDHHLTLMRDGLMQSAAREFGLDTQGYRPAILFVNGEYWGIHNLQEALEKNYFAHHNPGVDADHVDYLEGYPPGTFVYEGSANHYHALDAFLHTNNLNAAGAFEWVRSQMDVDNFRDYKIAEAFYYRWDIGNHRLWRPRTDDGRLRWILFDCDVGFGGFWSEPQPWNFDMVRAVLEPSGSLHGHNNETTVFLLKTLLTHPEFRDDFILRAADLMNTTFASDRFLERIDHMSQEISSEVAEHTARWRYPTSISEWRGNVEALRTFARLRPDAMRRHLAEYFGLSGTAKVRLAASPIGGGTLQCHSLEGLPGSTGAWEGTYFRNVPLPVTATASPGWRFAGWRELPGNTQSTVRLAMTADATLTAVFVRTSAPEVTISRLGPDGSLRLRLSGLPGESLVIEGSSDLQIWSTLATVVIGPEGWTDRDLARSGEGYFVRVRSLPSFTSQNP